MNPVFNEAEGNRSRGLTCGLQYTSELTEEGCLSGLKTMLTPGPHP